MIIVITSEKLKKSNMKLQDDLLFSVTKSCVICKDDYVKIISLETG